MNSIPLRHTVLLGFGKSLENIPDFLKKFEPQYRHLFHVFSDGPIDSIKHRKDLNLIKEDFEFFSDYRVIKSPGIPPRHPMVRKAQASGLNVLGEFDVCMPFHTGKRILVSGSNGKTTVTSLVEHMSTNSATPFHAVGNIGIPVSEKMLTHSDENFVIEASSYQLHDNQPFNYDVYVLTSLSADHIDWHGSESAYFQAKIKPIVFFRENHRIIVSEQASIVLKQILCNEPEIHEVKKLEDASQLSPFFSLKHNQVNLALATKALSLVSKAMEEFVSKNMKILAPTFVPPKYRCIAYNINDLRVINDSKSTNVDSTIAALEAIHGRVILFLGGQAKKESFKRLLPYEDKIELAIIYGFSKNKIAEELSAWQSVKIEIYDSLSAFFSSPKKLETQSTIVFSPGCASFDEFNNYLERGSFFDQQIATRLK